MGIVVKAVVASSAVANAEQTAPEVVVKAVIVDADDVVICRPRFYTTVDQGTYLLHGNKPLSVRALWAASLPANLKACALECIE